MCVAYEATLERVRLAGKLLEMRNKLIMRQHKVRVKLRRPRIAMDGPMVMGMTRPTLVYAKPHFALLLSEPDYPQHVPGGVVYL